MIKPKLRKKLRVLYRWFWAVKSSPSLPLLSKRQREKIIEEENRRWINIKQCGGEWLALTHVPSSFFFLLHCFVHLFFCIKDSEQFFFVISPMKLTFLSPTSHLTFKLCSTGYLFGCPSLLSNLLS